MNYTSTVIGGAGRGKKLGFPTFNLEIPTQFTVAEGIYGVAVDIAGVRYKGAMHFGPIPVFNNPKPSLEIFVLDYEPTNPVTTLTFEIIKFLRPIQNFSSPQELAAQIAKDVTNIRSF